MRHVSLRPSSFALPLWLRPRSNGHKRMPRQNRLRPSPRSRRKIFRRAMGEEGGESFDHLVGAGEQRWRYFQAERLRGDQIDDKIELSWLLHRKFCGLRPAQNLIDIIACTTPQVWEACAIRHQAAHFDIVADTVHSR